MSRPVKGALAAAGAAVLLLGGGGSLAYWTATQNVDGGDLQAGHLALITDTTNTGCGEWTLDTGEAPPTTYTAGDLIVPGDVLSKECAFTVQATGNHLRATVSASTPNLTGTLSSALTVDATDLEVNGVPATEFTDDNDGQALTFTVTVTFDSASDNTTQDLTATLAAITITATLVHN